MMDFLLKLHASGLGHDAVIEIMIALVGVMIAVLTLVAGLFAAVVAVVGVFGFQTIRTEAKRGAEKVAQRVATEVANDVLKQMWEQIQASGMSEGQAEQDIHPAKESSSVSKPRRKALTDTNLREDGDK